MLANYTLGGGFNSRLNINLREDKGWTYGAGSGFSGSDVGGDFRFASAIRVDATDSALSEIMREMKLYGEKGITPDELSFMKSALGQTDALRYETPGQKAQFIRRILDNNLPGNYPELQNKILKSISKGDIDALTKKYIKPDQMNILLVGDKAKIMDGIKKLGYPIIELDVDGNPVGKKGF